MLNFCPLLEFVTGMGALPPAPTPPLGTSFGAVSEGLTPVPFPSFETDNEAFLAASLSLKERFLSAKVFTFGIGKAGFSVLDIIQQGCRSCTLHCCTFISDLL